MELIKDDENILDKKCFQNVKLIHKDVYNSTVNYLTNSGFEYIFDLVVFTEDIKKTYITVVNTAENIEAFKQFLINKGIENKHIFNIYDPIVTYALRLVINNNIVTEIEPVYLKGELSHGFSKEDMTTFLPEIIIPFEDAIWVEGDTTFGYRFTNTSFFNYVLENFSLEYDRFITKYSSVSLDRLYGVMDNGILKFYYYTAYREENDISNGWFTKLVYDNSADDFIIHEYTGYFNEKKVLNRRT